MFTTVSHDIKVSVSAQFVEDQSEPDKHKFLWTYNVLIENHSQQVVQLTSRTWEVTDANGRTEHILGEGVVGQKPTLKPSESFEYSSFVPLRTPTGIMRGFYTMKTNKGEVISVTIPAFSLDCRYDQSMIH